MTAFRTHGFLSDEARDARPGIRAAAKECFALCDALNETGHRVLYTMKVDRHNQADLLLAILLGRLLSNFQGAIAVTELLMEVEGKILARAALETMFAIRASLNDPEVIPRLVEAEHRNRKVMREALVRAPEVTDADRARLMASLANDPKGERLNVEAIASVADQRSIYDLYYRSLSQVSHLSLGALERYVSADSTGEITSLEYGPPKDQSRASEILKDTLVPAMFSMLLGLDGVVAGLKLADFSSDIEKLRRQYHELLPVPPSTPAGEKRR